MVHHRFESLAVADRHHWLTISDMHRNLISFESVAPGVDLYETMQAATAAWQADYHARGPTGAAWGGHVFLAADGAQRVTIVPVGNE